MLFNNAWSQKGHSASCTASYPLNLQITKSDIRPHIQWAVNLIIADNHFIIYLPQGFAWICMGQHNPFMNPNDRDDI